VKLAALRNTRLQGFLHPAFLRAAWHGQVPPIAETFLAIHAVHSGGRSLRECQWSQRLRRMALQIASVRGLARGLRKGPRPFTGDCPWAKRIAWPRRLVGERLFLDFRRHDLLRRSFLIPAIRHGRNCAWKGWPLEKTGIRPFAERIIPCQCKRRDLQVSGGIYCSSASMRAGQPWPPSCSDTARRIAGMHDPSRRQQLAGRTPGRITGGPPFSPGTWPT